MTRKLPDWLGGLAALVLTTAAFSSGAAFVSSESGQNVSFKARAGMRGVLDIDINGSATGLVAREKGGKLVVEAPVASFSTNNGPRDRHLRSVLKAQEHPKVVLSVNRGQLAKLNDGESKEGNFNGQMSIAGKTHAVPVKYRAQRTGQDYKVQAMFFVDIKDFGIEPPCKGPVCVDPKVTIVVKSFTLRDES